MRAVDIVDGTAIVTEVEAPVVGPGQVAIAVRAAGVNRADLVQRAGRYSPPPGASAILGLEVSGEVVEVGAGADWAVGDRVCALLGGGGYAERVVVDAGHVLPIPTGLDWVQAAALPEVFATAWLNLYGEARLQPGERVLLHAGASGVGTAAIQLCRASGNPCFVVVGSEEKIARCIALGAAGGHNRHEGSFVEAVKAWAPGGVDVILDPVGAESLPLDIHVLATRGRVVLIGLLSGRTAELNLGRILVKRLQVLGSVLRARSSAEKDAIVAGLREAVWPLLERGEVQPLVERVFELEQTEQAHALLASNNTVGKLILTL